MPGMDGYELCGRLRAQPATALLPVILVTSPRRAGRARQGPRGGRRRLPLKPVNWEELFARVRSLLRVKSLQDELKELNQKLEQRVRRAGGAAAPPRPPEALLLAPVAEAIVAGGEELLEPHRREITAVFLDLRGFTAFTDRADPDQVLELLRAYHATLGRTVNEFSGTLEHFAGDGVMIFFNDPLPVDRPAERAVRMALALQQAFTPIAEAWAKLGHEVGLGIGIAQGDGHARRHRLRGALGVRGDRQRAEPRGAPVRRGARRRDHPRRARPSRTSRTSPRPSRSARSACAASCSRCPPSG